MRKSRWSERWPGSSAGHERVGAGLVLGQVTQAVAVGVSGGIAGIAASEAVLALPPVGHAVAVGVALDLDGRDAAVRGDEQRALVAHGQVSALGVLPHGLVRVQIDGVCGRAGGREQEIAGDHESTGERAAGGLPLPEQRAVGLAVGLESAAPAGVDHAAGDRGLALEPRADLPGDGLPREIEAQQPAALNGQDFFVCVTYTLFGGLYAVIGTDYIQSLLILIGIVIIGVAVFQIVDFTTVYSDLQTEKPMLLNALLPASIMAVFNNLLFGVGEVFHSNVWWSRVFAMSEKAGRRAYWLGGLFWLPVPVAAGFIALASGSIGINITRPDMVGPLVAASVLGEAGAIVVFMVFFCSLASSLDSLLASTADLITQDIYKKMIKPNASDRQLRKVSARIILASGFLAWLVCLPRIGTLADVLFFAGPLVASTIWPIATGLYWRKANTRGAVAGMIAGSATGMIFYFMVGWYSASLVGAAVSMIVVVLFTRLYPGRFEWHKLDESAALNNA